MGIKRVGRRVPGMKVFEGLFRVPIILIEQFIHATHSTQPPERLLIALPDLIAV